MPATIKQCTCKHSYQDARYGENKRVHVLIGPAKNPEKGWRCTVCNKETRK